MLRNHRYYRIILIDGNRLNSAQKYVQDTESRLYYLQSRYYDPEMGRVISENKHLSTKRGTGFYWETVPEATGII